MKCNSFWSDHFESRILYNASKAFAHQISKGDKYSLLAPVYSLNIINDTFSVQKKVWYHHYRLSHQSLPERYINGMEFVLIELPNFIAANYGEKKLTVLWLRYLKEIENKTTMISEELLEVPEIAEAVEALKETSYSIEELEQYEKYWDIVRTQKTMLHDATMRGMIEGEKKGEKKGEKRGEKRGEKKTSLKIAQRLADRGFPLDEIVTITGLSPDEIEKLLPN